MREAKNRNWHLRYTLAFPLAVHVGWIEVTACDPDGAIREARRQLLAQFKARGLRWRESAWRVTEIDLNTRVDET